MTSLDSLRTLLRDKSSDLTAGVCVVIGQTTYQLTLGELLSLTVYGAGRSGGTRVKEKHGREHFKAAGKKGGDALKEKLGSDAPAHFHAMGSRSIEVMRARHGDEKLHEIRQAAGRKGGQAVKAKHGVVFYEEIGRKGADKMKGLVARGKAASSDESEE